jgi:hypothetical protein
MKDWSKERWRKLYLREALEQRPWSVMARGLRDYLLRLAEDDGGLIRDADDPLQALLLALGAHDGEAELVRAALELLRKDGFLTGTARSIFVRNLPAAQSWNSQPVSEALPETLVAAPPPSSSTERVRRHRERQRQASSAEPPTLRSATGTVSEAAQTVTAGVTPSVSSAVSCNVTAGVTASRGSRSLNPSGSFLDPQKNREIDHPPSSERASGVSGSVSSGVTGCSVPLRSKPDEEDEEQLVFSGGREEALRLPVATRAKLIVDRPALSEVMQPESWPELVSVSQVFARSTGVTEQRLGRYQRDSGVRAIVELFAEGFSQRELEHVAQVVPKQSWWSAHGRRLGLSSLSIEVVRRNLPDDRPRALSPQVARVLAYLEQRREVG